MLQRSPRSFRRQGSSGRVWNIRIESLESQDTDNSTASPRSENGSLQIKEQETLGDNESAQSSPKSTTPSATSTPPSSSPFEDKVYTGFIIGPRD
ncbi:hypothetical protein K1719_009965 [Acacia pycnantha]|nr:hypothetical protein K1719_009965 [Acacia pycnantha]